MEPVDIDGARGEGGGQILRTSLALSMITGKPLVMRNIRAGRAKPGLRRQHLACVHAARDLCGATVHGDEVSSKYLEFTPSALVGGERTIDIGTMGSSTLVVQTVLLPMITGGHALRLVIRGGTHNPMAPPFEFLDRVFLPVLRAMGARISMTLDRHGFIGERGDLGQLTIEIAALPADASGALRRIELVDAPPVTSRHATAILARLPTHIADREFGVVMDRLGWSRAECEIRETRYGGPGNALLLEVERELDGPSATATFPVIREIVSEIGEKGIRAELVATRACDQMERYLAANVPVGEHLADQLLLPMALAGGGRFRCAPLSLHATTNIETIGRFLDVPIRDEPDGDNVLVTVG
ncbi:MAG: RNA 3'-terminal phosphate cyclase [Kofleriaceae bacterium]